MEASEQHISKGGDMMADKVTLTDATTGEIVYPQTLVDSVQNESGELLPNLVLMKDNTTAFTPTQDYQPATKKYVDDNTGGLPIGSIIMWSGLTSDIPAGYNLCDGTNGTPDLISKFIVPHETANIEQSLGSFAQVGPLVRVYTLCFIMKIA